MLSVEGFSLFVCLGFFLSPSNISVLIALLSKSPPMAFQSAIREIMGMLLVMGTEEGITAFIE